MLKGKSKILKWLLRDLIIQRRSKFFIVLLFDIVSLGCQFGAFALLFRYVNILESSGTWQILEKNYHAPKSFYLLLIVAVSVGFLFLISSLFDYLSRIVSLRLSRSYEEFCSQRLIHELSNSEYLLAIIGEKGNGVNLKSLKKSLIKDTRYCGKIVALVSRSFINFGKFFISLIFMIYVNFSLTAIILILLIPLFIVLRNVSKKVVKQTRKREKLIFQFVNERRKLLQNILSVKFNNDGNHPSSNVFDGSGFYDVYYSVFKKLAFHDLYVTLFRAFLSLAIILIAGNTVLSGNMDWSVFIAYMIAIRFFFTSMQGFNVIIKQSSRFYDYVNHYHSILKTLKVTPTLESIEKWSHLSKEDNTAFELFTEPDDDDDDNDDEADL